MERRPLYDWRGQTPKELVEAVSHLRKQYDEASWNINQVTEHLCYSALHPSEPVKDLPAYQRAFEQMKGVVGRSVVLSFIDTISGGTAPASFAAYFSIRKYFLRGHAGFMFQELLSIADVQRSLLPSPPPAWANAQVQSLIDEEVWKTPHWLKSVCDVQGWETDENLDESFEWRKWRAPLLLVMKPSRSAPFDLENIWQRQDEDKTLKWLELFTEDVIYSLEKVLRDSTGEALLAELKRQPITRPLTSALPSTHPSPPTVELINHNDLTFTHTDDFRSIQYDGQNYSLTVRQAGILKLLHNAYLSGHPDVSKAKLLGAVESETSEVRNIFKGSPLWKSLIVSAGRRGVYRLRLRKVIA